MMARGDLPDAAGHNVAAVRHRERRTPPRLLAVFNIQGSEIVFLLLIALVVLGPEKLPDAIRKFTRTYAEFKKVAGGFQGELRQVLDEPMRELRETADAVRQAAVFDPDADPEADDAAEQPLRKRPKPAVSEIAPRQRKAGQREAALNFGTPAARRPRPSDTDPVDTESADQPAGQVEPALAEPASAEPAEDAAE